MLQRFSKPTSTEITNIHGRKTKTGLILHSSISPVSNEKRWFVSLQGHCSQAAAKLYLSFVLSKEFQSIWYQWPVRTDVPSPGGYKSIQHHNTSPVDFHHFMRDRALVERFKMQIEELIGPAKGINPMMMGYSKKP